MTSHFADRLIEAIARKGSPVCVGLDPAVEKLPPALAPPAEADDQARLVAIEQFCLQVLEIVEPIVPAVKPQSAYFEAYGASGLEVYFRLTAQARRMGLVVIGDVKRGDIGPTAGAYAQGHLGRGDCPDSITVNPYFGEEGITPFAQQARRSGRGIFVLVRTSNPSAAELQDYPGKDGSLFYEHIARCVAHLGDDGTLIGSSGFSLVGAVVAATYPRQARRLRELMPRQIFLVPGYGAQGASAGDCACAFKTDGTGAIVNASRSVIFAYQGDKYADLDWKQAVKSACTEFAREVRQAVNA